MQCSHCSCRGSVWFPVTTSECSQSLLFQLQSICHPLQSSRTTLTHICSHTHIKLGVEMKRRLRGVRKHTVPAQDRSLVPSTCFKWLTRPVTPALGNSMANLAFTNIHVIQNTDPHTHTKSMLETVYKKKSVA